MKQPRDYHAEYARRKQRGLGKGLTLAQARGHAKGHKPVAYDRALEEALRSFRDTGRLVASARKHHKSAERLREYAKRVKAVRKVRGNWQFLRDIRGRAVPLFTEGLFKVVTVKGFASASKGFKYMIDADRFLHTNDLRYITKWAGEGVEDISGRWVPFETRPNVLYRLNAVEKEPFEQIYRIVI